MYTCLSKINISSNPQDIMNFFRKEMFNEFYTMMKLKKKNNDLIPTLVSLNLLPNNTNVIEIS